MRLLWGVCRGACAARGRTGACVSRARSRERLGASCHSRPAPRPFSPAPSPRHDPERRLGRLASLWGGGADPPAGRRGRTAGGGPSQEVASAPAFARVTPGPARRSACHCDFRRRLGTQAEHTCVEPTVWGCSPVDGREGRPARWAARAFPAPARALSGTPGPRTPLAASRPLFPGGLISLPLRGPGRGRPSDPRPLTLGPRGRRPVFLLGSRSVIVRQGVLPFVPPPRSAAGRPCPGRTW